MTFLINDVISKQVFARLTRRVKGLKLYHDDFYLGRVDQVVFSGCNLLMTHQYPNWHIDVIQLFLLDVGKA